jgi:hypothetical protein
MYYPSQVFQKSTTKAIWSLIKILSFVTLGVVIIANTPWYLLPIGWLFLGTSVTGVSLLMIPKKFHDYHLLDHFSFIKCDYAALLSIFVHMKSYLAYLQKMIVPINIPPKIASCARTF